MPTPRSEIRKDYIEDKYVIIAPRRGVRPHDFVHPHHGTRVHPRDCRFCPANLGGQRSILTVGDGNRWLVKVIANKFPAVSLDNPKAYGTQEVVIDTPDHRPELEDLSVEHIASVLEVYASRTKAISEDPKIEYILIFKNSGGPAGASIQHSHSQIFATQLLPPHLFLKSQNVQAYKLKHGRCVYCDVVARERRSPRLVGVDGRVVAFTPYASSHTYEVWLVPQRHLDNITLLNPEERESFARLLQLVLRKIKALGLPYNFYFHQVIHDEDQHLYLKIVPRGAIWAGVEIGSGVLINPISPETAARYYRAKK